jgi:hypothetical protein
MHLEQASLSFQANGASQDSTVGLSRLGEFLEGIKVYIHINNAPIYYE